MTRFHYVLLPAILFVFVAIYQLCLADLYAYEMMRPLDFNWEFWLLLLVSMAGIFLIFPARIDKPSDLFLFFYLLIAVLWASVLWNGTHFVSPDMQPVFFGILWVPAVAVCVARALLTKRLMRVVEPVQLGSDRWIVPFFFFFLLTGAVAAFLSVGTGSLDWQSVYDRRLSGRDAMAGNVLLGYVVNMASNGALPMVGFLAGYHRSPLLAVAGAAFVVLMFFLLGIKSTAMNFLVLGAIGVFFRYRSLRGSFVDLFLLGVLGVYIVALYRFVSTGDTILADYVIRRISMVQPQVQSYYFDFWMRGGVENILLNARASDFSDTTYAVGLIYLGNPATNANVNAFTYALGNGGIFAYVLSVAVVSAFVLVVDVLAAKTGRPEFFALGALSAILLSEQAWTTMLLTSGLAVCVVLVMLYSYPHNKNLNSVVRNA